MFEPIKVTRCPRCKADYPDLIEVWDGRELIFTFDDAGYSRGIEGSVGDPVRIEGVCRKCSNVWTLRGVTLGDLIGMYWGG